MSEIKFGTGGFRAVIGDDFNKLNAQKICQAISNIINKNNLTKKVCVGYDNRFMSETFAVWCSEVFAGNGIEVELFDSATATPVCMYATKVNGYDYGIMITASHNPYMYNGIKVFVREGRDASLEDTALIEKEILLTQNINFAEYKNVLGSKIILVNYIEAFVNSIISLLELDNCGKGLNVVFDCMYGSSASEIELLASKIGLKNYTILNKERDAFFGFIAPAPNEKNIDNLKLAVKNRGAKIGFALDADGDRLAVVDERGRFIDNNSILAISYYFLVKYVGKKGDAVKNVATSNLLNKVAEKFGYICREVPVGFKYVSSALSEFNAVVGGESSGGLAIQGHIWGKDSLIAICLCLKAMSVLNKSFGEIYDEVLTFVGGYNCEICDKQYYYSVEKKKQIDCMLFEYNKTPEHRYEVDSIVFKDYIKVYYKNGNWSLIRFSGTEPILRIFAEAESKETALKLIEDWEKLLGL